MKLIKNKQTTDINTCIFCLFMTVYLHTVTGNAVKNIIISRSQFVICGICLQIWSLTILCLSGHSEGKDPHFRWDHPFGRM